MSSALAQRPFPLDLIYAVLELLVDRRDLHAATLTNWDWNRAATPLLYRTLDSDTRSKKHNKEVRLRPVLGARRPGTDVTSAMRI